MMASVGPVSKSMCLALPPRPVLDRLRQVYRLDLLAPRQACPESIEGSAIVRASFTLRVR
jgi:hypothetical protein